MITVFTMIMKNTIGGIMIMKIIMGFIMIMKMATGKRNDDGNDNGIHNDNEKIQ